ncbi:signal peptidase I [Microbacterium phyllosphaerae]|uniref:signal peptidase I n=1 Tax=Microbacterium phyllosphaerae TaxID=124798 RepID=UPI002166C778|nr:signal peptidase I [Microbacterium phyllosphaerae]MCS3442185.1 signal peptidase I [Microbacterium phyllosphaerae]
MKKLIRIVLMCVTVAAVLALAVPLAWRLISGDYYMTVTGESMVPTYQVGDVLVVQKPTDHDLTQVGNIVVVTFTPGDRDTQYVHRVHEITADGVVLKGDGNGTPDPNKVTTAQLEGTPRLALTGPAGTLFQISQQPVTRIIVGVIVVGMIFVSAALRPTRDARRKLTDA